MTKLMEWLFGGSLFLAFHIAIVKQSMNSSWSDSWFTSIIYHLPVILIILFGVYAATVVLWRVLCFNECKAAAIEIQQQITLAKNDLRSKGMVFKEDTNKLEN